MVWGNTRTSCIVCYPPARVAVVYGVDNSSVIAAYIAEAAPTNKTILIDTFAGVGGNTIAFALSGRWEQIFAIEKDPRALMCAKHNAEIYGVAKKIWWIGGDCFDILKKRLAGTGKNAVVFGSPPWGGPGYISDAVFKLESMQPYNLQTLHSAFTKLTKEVVLFLPRTSDLNELAELQTGDRRLIVTHYCMKGASKVGDSQTVTSSSPY